MKTSKRRKTLRRKTLTGKIRNAARDFRKELEAEGYRDVSIEDVESGATHRQLQLAEHGTPNHRSEELWEVFRILERQALLTKGTLTSSGGPDAEATLAAKCIRAVKKPDADFFRRLANEVHRQSERLKEKSAAQFHHHLLLLKQMNRWRIKSGLPELTLRQVKADPDRPETKRDVLVPSNFDHFSDRQWHKEAKTVGLVFLKSKGGRPNTRNK